MLLSDYLGIGTSLDELGVFDPMLDEDSSFFINLQRLKATSVPEFINSYTAIREYFRKIIKLLDRANSKSDSDTFYRQALSMFNFSEVNGICLGYARGTRGSGFGAQLTNQVISTAYDIVKSGVEDPEFFELLPLFQKNVGSDRLSDMIATLILPDIKAYTERINHDLNINPENYNDLEFKGEFLVNPYKGDSLLLVPIDILHDLPVARSWSDVEFVASNNQVIRAEMNSEVAAEWSKYSADKRKGYLLREVFETPDKFSRVIEKYREETLNLFDPKNSLKYLLSKTEQILASCDLNYAASRNVDNSYIGAMDILSTFKDWVEYNKGWEVIHQVKSGHREKVLQRVIHLAGKSYIKANNLDMSCEPDEGRGPVDFKISMGQDLTIIEVKLSTNSNYLHGYKTQIEEYGKAEQTDKMIFVLVDLGNPGRVKTIQDFHNRKVDEGLAVPELIIIDATQKESASKA